jgi:hypothetical protein
MNLTLRSRNLYIFIIKLLGMNIKHSKYKNTGILFELLVRQVTADTLNGGNSPALGIIKKYFVKGELSKELKLYETLTKKTNLSESYANTVLQTLLESSKKLNRTSLKKSKYNLINEIKKNYSLDEFFKTKVPHYKIYAAFYTLTEIENAQDIISPDQIITNKVTLLEQLSASPIEEKKVKEDVIQEFQTYDKDTRILAYKILLEKFNGKYSDLYDSQKIILKEFINSVDSTPRLREFYNSQVNELKSTLQELSAITTDKAIQIKLNEVASLLTELDKTASIKTDNLVDLLQYCELVEELKIANG